jgi:hypothetical protein
MIKKLLLITSLTISTSLWADSEDVCDITQIDDPRSYKEVAPLIKQLSCEEGDILNVTQGRNFVQIDEQMTIALHCDLEETVHRTNMGFVCILANLEGIPIKARE